MCWIMKKHTCEPKPGYLSGPQKCLKSNKTIEFPPPPNGPPKSSKLNFLNQ